MEAQKGYQGPNISESLRGRVQKKNTMEKKLVTLRQMETMALHRDGGMVADGTTLVEVMIRLEKDMESERNRYPNLDCLFRVWNA